MQPLRSFPRAGRGWILLVLLLLVPTFSQAQSLRVMTWNLLNYPFASGASREPAMRSVVNQIQPDLMVAEEIQGLSAANQFLNNVLNVLNPGEWALATFTLSPDSERACFYRTAKLDLQGSVVLSTALRTIPGWFFRPDGTFGDSDFRIYAVHLKAAQGATEENQRLAEATILRNHLNALPSDTHFMVLGDYNIYTSAEAAFVKLTGSEVDNDGRLFDPANRVGDWHDNAAFSDMHSQSPRTTSLPDGGATGGMDDRFDMALMNDDMLDFAGLEYHPGSYTTFGQDGNHFNAAINSGPNAAVPDSIADALHDASDHIPVFVDLDIVSSAVPPIMAVSGDVNFGPALIGAFVQRPVAISNQATAPANDLTFSTAAGAGFTIQAAPGPLGAGNTDSLLVTMNTVAFGNRQADILVTGNDPSNPADTLIAMGEVLAHARPSLGDFQETTVTSVFLGVQQQGTFSDSTLGVHNFLWNALQAPLDAYSFSVTGPDSAHFTLVGFSPTTISGTPGSVALHFDDTNVTASTVYMANVVLHTSDDQSIPGATNLSDLTWGVTAIVTDLATDAPQVVLRTQLHHNVPNPFNPTTTIAFDLAVAQRVQLFVFDSRGRHIRSLVEDEMNAGQHRVLWDGRDQAGRSMASGIYFYRMRTAQFEQTQRMTLIR